MSISIQSAYRVGRSMLLPLTYARAALLLALSLVATPLLRAEMECKGPPELEARLQTGKDGSGYSDLGTWFGQRHQFSCANQAFRSALRLDPGSAKVNYFLGLSLYSSGQKKEALGPLGRSSQLDPKAMQPRLLLAAILEELGRHGDAEAQWKAALAIDPASSDALDGLSKAFIVNRDFMSAINLLRDAKRDEDLNLNLASAYGQQGMLDEAATTIREALSANPSSLRLTSALVTVYVHQHRYQDARVLLQEYLAQHPSDTDSQIQYLSVLVLTSDSKTARPLGQKLLAAAPHNFDVLYLNGILEREAEEYAVARDHLQEAVKLQPGDYTAHYNLGATLGHLNDPVAARQQLEKAITIDASQPDAHFQLAIVLRTLKETHAAQEQLDIYQQLKRGAAASAEAKSKASQAAQKLIAGDAAQAIVLYREAVKATPDDALLQFQLAMALDQAADPAGERAALVQAVRIDPTFALAQNQLGFLDSRSGDPEGAEAHFRRAVESAPTFTEAWINLTATLASESKFSAAQEALANALRLEPRNEQALALGRQLDVAAHR